MPSSELITSMGSFAVNSRTKSASPAPTSASRYRHAISRMRGSSSAMRRGVKTFETRFRIRVCRGGSMKMIMGTSYGSPFISSSTVPHAELKVSWSTRASRQSW